MAVVPNKSGMSLRERTRPGLGTCSAAVVSMTIVMIMPAVVLARRRAAHGDTARLAELPVLRFHARCDPCHVGDDVGTKPHRIGRARLTGRIATLGRCAIETTKQQGEQGNGADQIYDPHVYPLDLATFRAGEFADEMGRRPAQSKRLPKSLPRSLPKSRLRGHLLAQRWRKYDLARYAERSRPLCRAVWYFAGT